MTKQCNKCGQIKDISLFAKGGSYKDGRRNYCKKCHSGYVTQYIKENPAKRSKSDYKRRFKRHGLTEEQFKELFDLYSGKCHSCKDRDANNIDHDHKCCPGSYSCGKCVRGMLCSQCNTALGLLNDDLQKIKNLIQYIN